MSYLLKIVKNRVLHIFVFFLSGVFALASSYEPASSGVGGWMKTPWSQGAAVNPVLACIGAGLLLAAWLSYKQWTFERQAA